MAAQTCSGNHATHICELSRQGKHIENTNITSYPQCMCMNCGQVANSGSKLCNPRALDNIRPSGT